MGKTSNLAISKEAIQKRRDAEEKSEHLRVKVTALLEKSLSEIESDLAEMSPKERWDTLSKLAPYAMRKLQPADTNIRKPADDDEDELTRMAKKVVQKDSSEPVTNPRPTLLS